MKTKTKTCPVCTAEFTFIVVHGYNYKYCSDECHRERRRQRARAKPKKPKTKAQRAKEAARRAVLNKLCSPEQKEARKQRVRKSREKNREANNKKAKEKRLANYEVERAREKAQTAKNKLRRQNDPAYAAHCRERNNRYRRKKMHKDINLNITNRVRSRIAMAARRIGIRKVHRTITLLGCTADEFKQYLQRRFTKGMTWEKFLTGAIHIDHIKPCNSFNLIKTSEQKKCFHYTNCQPLWAMDNYIKGTN